MTLRELLASPDRVKAVRGLDAGELHEVCGFIKRLLPEIQQIHGLCLLEKAERWDVDYEDFIHQVGDHGSEVPQ